MLELSRALGQRAVVEDAAFDRFYPPEVARLSSRHFTPVEVALRAAELLAIRPGMTILDVGAGAGKACIVGALSTDATFVGIERRPHLVAAARSYAAAIGAERARFSVGDAFTIDWSGYDGFYFFNPFHEHLTNGAAIIDRTVSLGPRHHVYAVWLTQAQLSQARLGARVVTYHGFGGRMPTSYRKLHEEPCGTDVIELWQKERELTRLPVPT